MNILVSLAEEAARGADSIAFIPSAGDEETALNPYYSSEQIGPTVLKCFGDSLEI